MPDTIDSATGNAPSTEVYPPYSRAVTPSPAPAPEWLDGRPRIGIHTSIAGEPSRALDTAASIGCTALQIFSGSPRMWPRPHQRTIAAPIAKRFRERRAELRLGPVAIHANYLINLASPDPIRWESSVAAFRDEIIRALQLGADYLIVHPGSPRDGGIARGIENVAEAVARAFVGARSRGFGTVPQPATPSDLDAGSSVFVPDGCVRVLFENTAGQGTGLASEFSHLRDLLEACRTRSVTPEPGICLDTAHLLAAGFEIRTPEGLDRTLDEADAAFSLENVRVIHCNDSKAPLAARIDRHQHIGRGHIGKEAFARILNHPRLRTPGRAFLAETPIDRPGDDRRNVRALWSLLGLTPPLAPPALRRSAGVPRRPSRTSASRPNPVGARHVVPHSSRSTPRQAQRRSGRTQSSRSPR
jgi:deoxyribonuclease-4